MGVSLHGYKNDHNFRKIFFLFKSYLLQFSVLDNLHDPLASFLTVLYIRAENHSPSGNIGFLLVCGVAAKH